MRPNSLGSVLLICAGAALIATVLWDAFESMVLPRRVTRRFRLTRLFYRTTWRPWSAVVRRVNDRRRRETLLGVYGPMSMLLLLAVWAAGLVCGFALVEHQLDARPDFPTSFYFSGTTFFTLGLGDIKPENGFSRVLVVIEGGLGFGFLAIVIGYLPVLYQAFSRREVNISLLDSRAGSPSSATVLLTRYAVARNMEGLTALLQDWERWSAEFMESHISYPVLCFFRSQHDNQSWVTSLTTILDVCALAVAGIRDCSRWQAKLTFASARHAVVDLAQVLNTRPHPPEHDRLPPAELARLRSILSGAGIVLSDGPEFDSRLTVLREMYEPYLNAISVYLVMPLAAWLPVETSYNWQTSAWEHRVKKAGASALFDEIR